MIVDWIEPAPAHFPPAWLDGEWLTGVLRTFVVLWSFALGASVGSFLNVVVHRLPAGLNLSKPKSRCPRCLTPIRATDNLPVIGWLRLRGRCRACRLPIAARYPLVEAACGALLAALALTVVLLGGANLPIAIDGAGHAVRFMRSLDAGAIGLCATLFAGSATLIAAGLIALDGHRLPWRLTAFGLLCPLIVSAVWPGVRVGAEPVWGGETWRLSGAATGWALGPYRFAPNLAGPLDAALGGTVCLGLCGAACFAFRGGAERRNLLLIGALAGTWWGWWAAAIGLAAGGATAFAAPVLYAGGAFRTRVPPPTAAAFAAALLPLGWAAVGSDPPPLAPRTLAGLALGGGLLIVGAGLDRLFFQAEPREGDASPPV